MPVLLGINIDHIATLRQARGTRYPEPVQAALVAEQAGADGITVHLREDRRHIQDRDVELLAQTLQTRMNLEMAATEEMVGIARRIRPAHCCLVPEKREELTTEGGLDVAGNEAWIKRCTGSSPKRASRCRCSSTRTRRRSKRRRAAGAGHRDSHRPLRRRHRSGPGGRRAHAHSPGAGSGHRGGPDRQRRPRPALPQHPGNRRLARHQ